MNEVDKSQEEKCIVIDVPASRSNFINAYSFSRE